MQAREEEEGLAAQKFLFLIVNKFAYLLMAVSDGPREPELTIDSLNLERCCLAN